MQLTLAKPLAGGLDPGFETRTGQQVASVAGGNIGANGRVALPQGGIGELLELQRIDPHRPLGPQQHLTCLQHDTVVAAQRLPCMVGRLAQVGGTGLGFELWPKCVDHFISSQPLARLQAQQLHELRGTQARPALSRQFDAVDRDRKSAEQEGIKA